MSTFVVSDIHGNFAMLWSLLNQEGLVDDEEKRTDLGNETEIISIGDLLNAVFSDVHGDEMCANVAEDWFDFVLVGNHEAPYLGLSPFGGYYEHPPLSSLYRSWQREGFARPAHVIGNTLITHAGLVDEYEDDFANAADAVAKIKYVFKEEKFGVETHLINGIGYSRGGRGRTGGILWSDWQEPKCKNFNQVVGHTPNPKGTELHGPRKDGTWTLKIDTGCKGGGYPSGVWLDESGEIIKIVSLKQQEENSGTQD